MDIDHLDKHKNKCYKEHVTFTFRKCIHTYKENVTHDVTHTFMAKKIWSKYCYIFYIRLIWVTEKCTSIQLCVSLDYKNYFSSYHS